VADDVRAIELREQENVLPGYEIRFGALRWGTCFDEDEFDEEEDEEPESCIEAPLQDSEER